MNDLHSIPQNRVTNSHSQAMNKGNGVVIDSRSQDWKGFQGFATGKTQVLMENELMTEVIRTTDTHPENALSP